MSRFSIQIRKQGFVRARVDGEIYEIENVPKLAKTKKHTIEAVVDRLAISDDIRSRMTDSVELALGRGRRADDRAGSERV